MKIFQVYERQEDKKARGKDRTITLFQEERTFWTAFESFPAAVQADFETLSQ